MAKEYNVGDRLYLPVWITNKESNLVMYNDNNELVTDAKFSYVYSQSETRSGEVRYGEPDLLLTAEEIYASRQTADKIEYLTDMLDYGRKKYDEIEELKSRNAELESLLKEVMATRDEAIKQNNELIADCANWKEAAQRYHDNAKVADAAADNLRKENGELKAKVAELIVENDNLKSDCNDWKDTADDRIVDVQNLTAERDNLKADLTTQKEVNEELKTKIADLTAWYEEANKTATEAAEANDDLKAKIADLRNRVGEQLAQIQDLNAEVHFHKEFGEGLDKQQKELQARYDELDSVNKEQAEKIRKLDAQNAYLKRLSDAKKKMRIVLNNGSMYDVEVGDKVHPVYDMNNNLFFVKTEGGTVTSFLIGKEPGNIAGWYLV